MTSLQWMQENARFICNTVKVSGAVYNLSEPLLPLASLAAVDSTYASGHCGLFGFDTSNTGAVNVTFDSYSAGPAVVPVLTGYASGTNFVVEWPRQTGAWHLEAQPGFNHVDGSDVRCSN